MINAETSMTTTAYSLDGLVAQVTVGSRGVGHLHRLLALREDDRFAEQKMAALLARDRGVELLLRQVQSRSPGSAGPLSVRDAIEQFGYRDARSASTMATVAAIIGGDRGAVSRELWRWLAALMAMSSVTSMATGRHREVATAAPLMAHLGYLMLASYAPDLVTEAVAFAERHGVTRIDAERTLAGFSEFDLATGVVASWDLDPELLELARGHHDSPLAAHLARAARAVTRLGYCDPLSPGDADTAPDPELDAALELRGGPEWVEFAVSVLLIAAPGS